MTETSPQLIAAQMAVTKRRARMRETVAALKYQVSPKRVARKMLVDATVAGEAAAVAGAEKVRRYPGALAGLVAVAGLFLARHRIADLFGPSPDNDD